MKVLIVYAHPEPKSFNGAMKDLAVEVLSGAGHQVQVTDLYAMKFKAVADRDDYAELANPDHFRVQAEQKAAHEQDRVAPDIAAEVAKLQWADLVIFQFPMWWFSLPAILKGYVDRVFTFGGIYGPGQTYEKGGLLGRKAMLAFTTGGPVTTYGPGARNGELDVLLYHIQHGMLWFVGMQVLPPFIAHAPVRITPEERQAYLDAYRQRLLTLDSLVPIQF